MHEPSFLAGLELGKFLSRLKRVEDGLMAVRRDLDVLGKFLSRLKRVEDGLMAVRRDLDVLTAKMRRAAILAALWTFALLANVSTDKAAEVAVDIVMSAWKH